MPTVVGNFVFISRIHFMMSWVSKRFYNPGCHLDPGSIDMWTIATNTVENGDEPIQTNKHIFWDSIWNKTSSRVNINTTATIKNKIFYFHLTSWIQLSNVSSWDCCLTKCVKWTYWDCPNLNHECYAPGMKTKIEKCCLRV